MSGFFDEMNRNYAKKQRDACYQRIQVSFVDDRFKESRIESIA